MASDSELLLTHIKPAAGWSALNLRELWRYRELIFFLTWRDLKVRYKQTALGATWAILQPVLNMIVFTIIFSNLGQIPSDGVPYPVFSFVAQLPWGLFEKALTNASRSLVGNNHMITKIYFPRVILPLSSILSGLVDFGIAFLVLIVLMIYYGITLTSAVWTLPLFILLAMVTALGVGLWLSALNVLYRDVNYVVPFLTQFWMFMSPVIYPASMIKEKLPLLYPFYALNPMVGVVDGFRWALLGSSEAPGASILISIAAAITLLITGLFYFRRMERLFADRV